MGLLIQHCRHGVSKYASSRYLKALEVVGHIKREDGFVVWNEDRDEKEMQEQLKQQYNELLAKYYED